MKEVPETEPTVNRRPLPAHAEYLILDLSYALADEIQTALNKRAADGWQLIYVDSGGLHYMNRLARADGYVAPARPAALNEVLDAVRATRQLVK